MCVTVCLFACLLMFFVALVPAAEGGNLGSLPDGGCPDDVRVSLCLFGGCLRLRVAAGMYPLRMLASQADHLAIHALFLCLSVCVFCLSVHLVYLQLATLPASFPALVLAASKASGGGHACAVLLTGLRGGLKGFAGGLMGRLKAPHGPRGGLARSRREPRGGLARSRQGTSQVTGG